MRYSQISLTVYLKKYAHGFCFAVLCCGYTLTDFPISTRLTSLALWQSNDCPGASKATLMNMDKYFMGIHYERLRNHNKAKHNKTVCIFLGIYCIFISFPECWGCIIRYSNVFNHCLLSRFIFADGYLRHKYFTRLSSFSNYMQTKMSEAYYDNRVFKIDINTSHKDETFSSRSYDKNDTFPMHSLHGKNYVWILLIVVMIFDSVFEISNVSALSGEIIQQ